jgi:predicted PurR-regulated permease PerM
MKKILEEPMKGNKVVAASLIIIVIFIMGVVIKQAKPVLFPFFLAIFLSFILSPILDFLTRKKIPKAVSILFILIITFFFIYLLGLLFYSSGKTFASEFPKYGQKISSILTSIQEQLKLSFPKWESMDLVGNIKAKVQTSFNQERSLQIIDVIQKIDKQIQKYLVIKTIVSFVTGVLATVVLMSFGVDFAIVFGFFTFILNYVPNIGSIIATALPLTVAAFQFETLWPAFWILIILGSIQMTIGNFIEPRVMGQGLGLSTLVVLFFLFFWGWLWGIAGMILAVPTAATIKIVCDNIPPLNFVGALMSKG